MTNDQNHCPRGIVNVKVIHDVQDVAIVVFLLVGSMGQEQEFFLDDVAGSVRFGA